MGLCVKPMEGQELLSFLSEEAEKVMRCFTNVFSDVIFYPLRTAIVLGIENYPSACMSCCSGDLGLLLTFEVCGLRMYQTENKSSPLYPSLGCGLAHWCHQCVKQPPPRVMREGLTIAYLAWLLGDYTFLELMNYIEDLKLWHVAWVDPSTDFLLAQANQHQLYCCYQHQ